MQKVALFYMYLIVILIFSLFFQITPALAKKEIHQFTLYPAAGPKKPYTLLFPLKADRTGQIRVYIKLQHTAAFFQIISGLTDKKNNKIILTRIFKKGKKGLNFRYGVDSVDLQKGSLFELFILNKSTKKTIRGELAVIYPVKGESENRAHPVYPDLAVENITLDYACQVEVAVGNHGPGALTSIFWKKNGPKLILSRNGRPWGGVSLNIIDPGHVLRHAGGRIVYHSRLKIGRHETIRAEITPIPRLKEVDEKNNILTETLSCPN